VLQEPNLRKDSPAPVAAATAAAAAAAEAAEAGVFPIPQKNERAISSTKPLKIPGKQQQQQQQQHSVTQEDSQPLPQHQKQYPQQLRRSRTHQEQERLRLQSVQPHEQLLQLKPQDPQSQRHHPQQQQHDRSTIWKSLSAKLQGAGEPHALRVSHCRPTSQVSGACELTIPNMRVHSHTFTCPLPTHAHKMVNDADTTTRAKFDRRSSLYLLTDSQKHKLDTFTCPLPTYAHKMVNDADSQKNTSKV